jgi:hypothetical protein
MAAGEEVVRKIGGRLAVHENKRPARKKSRPLVFEDGKIYRRLRTDRMTNDT